MNDTKNQFDLQRCLAGEPIETIEGRPRQFIAYRTDRRERLRLIVLDPVGDKLYSHSPTGEHCEQVRSLALRMKPKARRKVTQYVVSATVSCVGNTVIKQVFNTVYDHESDAKAKASIATDGQVHPIQVEVDA